jgi:hypothetical protein
MTSSERRGPVDTIAGGAPVRGTASTTPARPRPVTPVRPVAWWALICAGLCATLLPCAWLVAGALQPAAYNPIHQTVSVLAGRAGMHRWIVTGALLLVGVCYLATAAGLAALRRCARVGLVVAGAAAIGIALCPEPVKGTTTEHMTCTSIGAATIAIWPALTTRRGGHVPTVLSVPVTAATTVAFLALLGWLLFEARTDGRVGLAERLDSSVQVVWPFVVAVALRAHRPPAARHDAARPVG